MGAIRIGLRHGRWSANSQEFLGLDDAMGLARFLCRSGGELAEGEMKRTNCMYPRTEARCPSPARRRRSVCLLASVVAGRREQSKLAAPAAAAASSGSELQLFGEGGRRHHRHAGGGADHAVVHPRWADGRAASGDGPAEEPVVEAGARAGAVVAERARGGVVVEVADLRRVVVVSKATARSGVMSDCDSGISSSGAGSCSSHRANQLGSSSSLILTHTHTHQFFFPPNQQQRRRRTRGLRTRGLGGY